MQVFIVLVVLYFNVLERLKISINLFFILHKYIKNKD